MGIIKRLSSTIAVGSQIILMQACQLSRKNKKYSVKCEGRGKGRGGGGYEELLGLGGSNKDE